ncbi:MAG: hypothetical protein HY727_07070 [Candidatus Rokubacteria bacterium]|nr:hypothetical protein [Candidatus Rokubacteria bacterium]
MAALITALLATLLLATPGAAQTDFGGGDPRERYFKLDWTVETPKAASPRITGYVYNEYGRPAAEVRLLIEAFNTSDKVIAQRYEWVPGLVPALARAYFEVRGLPPAARYRVRVHSYTFVESGRCVAC